MKAIRDMAVGDVVGTVDLDRLSSALWTLDPTAPELLKN